MKYLFLLSFFVISINLYSQDIHSSQTNHYINHFNPSILPIYNDQFALSFNYRKQWSSFMDPMITSSIDVSGSMKGLFYHIGYLNDVCGVYERRYLPISLGYYSLQKNLLLSMAIGVNLNWKSIDFSKYNFSDEWNPNSNDFSLQSLDPYTLMKTSAIDYYLSMTVGFSENLIKRKRGMYSNGLVLSAAAYHYPNSRFFITNNANEYDGDWTVLDNWKFMGSAIGNIFISRKEKISLVMIYTFHGSKFLNSNESLLLGTYHYKRFSLGLGMRNFLRDIIVSSGFSLSNGMRAEFSYDLNLSRQFASTNSKGGFETTIIYEIPHSKKSGFDRRGRSRKKKAYACPSFGNNWYDL